MQNEIEKPNASIPELPWEPAPSYCDVSLYRRKIARPLALKLAPILVSLGFSGNGVSWLKLLVGLSGTLFLISLDARIGLVGMLLLHVHFVLDAADGEVARRRGHDGYLAGEYLDKIFDHLPKTAMYFFWGYGAYRLTGSQVPLFCGLFLAAWVIYPRFCLVETLLERLDKAPGVLFRPEFRSALNSAFVRSIKSSATDYVLTLFVHPALNLLTICYILEIFMPRFTAAGFQFSLRFIFIILYTFVSLVNLLRKVVCHFRALNFSHLDPPKGSP
ncbi:MAG: CDP-alcohol phosphatidyltransferase family protein [bacterium]|nr:CDP-alcohol phosphatidyltransferase family protein [bacterium]